MEDRTQEKTSSRWSRDSYIAAAVLAMIVAHLLLRFVFHWDQQYAAIPLFVGLAAGTPLVIDLLRKLLHFQFGSDLIAGVSIVSAVLLREYLVACVVILMLSGGQALETYGNNILGKIGSFEVPHAIPATNVSGYFLKLAAQLVHTLQIVGTDFVPM